MTFPSDPHRLVRELAEYWGAAAAGIPDQLFQRPALAPDYVRERLQALRALLPEAAYAGIRETIADVATGTTAESRRAEITARQQQEREAAAARCRAEEVRRAREADQRARTGVLRAVLYPRLTTDFLAVDGEALSAMGAPGEHALLQQLRNEFVRAWCTDRGIKISSEQAAAVGAVHAHALVRARAGSGKTQALVARTRFLTEHCGVAPEEVLILAFNTDAVADLSRRLQNEGGALPFVRTFHALAWQVVQPTEDILKDDGQESAFRDIALARFDHPVLGGEIRQLMLDRFTEDWHTLIQRGLHLPMAEGLALRRSMPLFTLRGDRVKSRGEQLIANFLFEHDLRYAYEYAHRWDERTYRPDFTVWLPERTIVMEYFGMTGEADYDRQAAQKRGYWERRPGHTLVELFPHDVAPGPAHLAATLRARLAELGVECVQLPEHAIWDRVRDRARSQFAAVVKSFMGRCRKQRLTPATLQKQIAEYRPDSEVERRFLRIAGQLFADYLGWLRQTGADDFDGLLERAIARVDAGQSTFERKDARGDLGRLRFVMVDEFQDFAPLYHDLLASIRRLNPRLQLLCVGDDWQAINAFAGATTRFFEDFTSCFSPADVVDLSENRRSGRRIVEVGNRVMHGLGAGGPARAKDAAAAGRVLVADLQHFSPTEAERARYGSDLLTPAVRRIVAHRLRGDGRVALLSRTNAAPRGTSARGLGDWADEARRGLAERLRERVDVCTAHKYKGREAETVVVLDAVDRKYPLVHPDWVFTRVLGERLEKLVEDERRLFYVACTRAIADLILVVNGPESPFLRGVEGLAAPLNWDEFPSRPDHGTAWVVRVTGRNGVPDDATYQVRDALKAHRFEYRVSGERYWVRAFARSEQREPADVVAALQRASWATQGDGLEVRIEDGFGSVHSAYVVSHGTWTPLSPSPTK